MCGEALRIDDLRRLIRLLALAVAPACGLSAALAAAYLQLVYGKPWMVANLPPPGISRPGTATGLTWPFATR